MKSSACRLTGWVLFLAALIGGCGPDLEARDSAVPDSRFLVDVWRQDDGLPQNTVTAILQTRAGRLYLGTGGGLARFDGVRFQTFSSGKFEAETHDIIGLYEDRRENLWIRLNTGLARLDPVEGRVLPVGLDGPVNIQMMFEDRSGRLWLAAVQGAFVSAGEAFHRLSGPGTVLSVDEDDRGMVVLDRENGFWRGDASGLKLGLSWQALGLSGIVSAARAAGCWYLATNRGIFRFEEASGKVETLGKSFSGIERDVRWDLYQDRSSRLWMYSEQAVQCLSPGQTEWSTVLDTAGLAAPFEAGDGTIWISTPKGLFRISGRGSIRPESIPLTGDEIYGRPYEDNQGHLWIGLRHGLARLRAPRVTTVAAATDGTPLRAARHLILDHGGELRACFDDAPFRVFTLREGRWSLDYDGRGGRIEGGAYYQDRDGVAWIFDWRFGLKRIRPDGTSLPLLPAARSLGRIQAFAQDQEGTIWLGTPEGLVRWDEERPETFRTAEGLPNDNVRDLLVDRDGALWMATSRGVAVRTRGAFSSIGPESLVVLKFLLDREGVVWMAATEGLFRFRAGKLVRFSVQDGLADEAIFSLQEDESGDFWLSYRRGLMRVKKSELDSAAAGLGRIRPQLFDRTDGMAEVEANASAQSTLRDRQGRIWFCTMGGAVAVDPAKLVINRTPPPVDIESVRADGVEYRGGSLILPAGTRRVEFRYTAADFQNPRNVRFAFRLEGETEPWTEGSGDGERAVSYTNLKPGRYRFHVRAANGDGAWNLDGAAVSLEIKPFFWQTAAFRISAALLLLAAAILVLRILKKFVFLLAFWRKNRLVGSYVLEEAIASGPASTVYRGHHWLAKNNKVAVKILKPERAGTRADIKRFKREGALIDMLETPRLVSVLARGEHAGTFYIVMEYLRGQTLAARLKSEPPVDRAEAVRILIQMAEALDEIHRHGIIHRDLKPSNIMLVKGPGRPASVKLLDFGVASGPVPEAGGETRFFSGTLAYIAPEQTWNRETPAADIYSLGMIAYELLAGERPFRGCRSHELLEAILHQRPVPLRTLVPDLPACLSDLVMAMLEKNPADRPFLDRILSVLLDAAGATVKFPDV